jgi:hypothetical protein
MEGQMRVSVVATGMDSATAAHPIPSKLNLVSSVGGTKVSHPSVPFDDDPASESLETGDDLGLDTAAAFQVTAADGSDIDEGRPDLRAAAATASPPAHTPDVFIPPLPVTRSGVETRSAPDPFKDAAMKNGIRPSEGETARAKPRVSSLFARVTGAGRVSRAAKPDRNRRPSGRLRRRSSSDWEASIPRNGCPLHSRRKKCWIFPLSFAGKRTDWGCAR